MKSAKLFSKSLFSEFEKNNIQGDFEGFFSMPGNKWLFFNTFNMGMYNQNHQLKKNPQNAYLTGVMALEKYEELNILFYFFQNVLF